MRKASKVVLYFPPYESLEISPPLSLIAIASPLVRAGYHTVIIDGSLPNSRPWLLEECRQALALGISVCTGPMIRGAIGALHAVKSAYPGLPVILGGWHPSILPEQTLQYPGIDAVVVRQGEESFLELLQRWERSGNLQGVAGTLVKVRGEIIRNPPRPGRPLRELGSRIPGYELIDYDRYQRQTGMRWIIYAGSRGCPYRCAYCSNATVYGQRYEALPAEQVAEELIYLNHKYSLKHIGIVDDIFFAHHERSLRIAEIFARQKVRFKWYIQDRTDSWSQLTPEQARLYRRAGLNRVHFGAESGSEKVLASIHKNARLESVWLALDRCQCADIRASFGVIFGLPSETKKDLLLTVDLVKKISQSYARANCHTNIFTPYPGAPLWDEAVKRGLSQPTSLAAWADIYPLTVKLPWLKGRAHRRVQAIRQFIRWSFPSPLVDERAVPKTFWREGLRKFSCWRIQHHFFILPLEITVYRWGKKLREWLRGISGKTLNGQPLAESSEPGGRQD